MQIPGSSLSTPGTNEKERKEKLCCTCAGSQSSMFCSVVVLFGKKQKAEDGGLNKKIYLLIKQQIKIIYRHLLLFSISLQNKLLISIYLYVSDLRLVGHIN